MRVKGQGMKVIIAGGGTGGHLYPGIALAREVLREAGSEVLFVGTEQGLEARVLPKEGLSVRFIRVGRLKGMKPAAIVKTIITLPWSLWQAMRLIQEVRPTVVIGIGGYASGPIALAAWIKGVPLIIVEPNSYAGLANRKLGRLADRVVLSFPGTNQQHFFPDQKTVQVGPLVRSGIAQGNRAEALAYFGLDQNRFTVFVMGGSGGAHAINMAMKEAATALASLPKLQILHQTGGKDADEVDAGYRAASIKANVLPYIDNMPGAYAAADLVISRSGATTVAELAVCGKSAVLIPYPFAADNHQEYNARSLAAAGRAEVLVQRELTPARLAGLIKKYGAAGPVPPDRMESDAANEIVRICKTYVQKD